MGIIEAVIRCPQLYQGKLNFQLLVKSVEARDWLICAEPTTVRAVIKRLIEDLSSLDSLIKPFMGEGTRKERSTESSSARSHARRNPNFDACSISSTLDKLWTERVDFCANIEFNRTSVLTAIVSVALKSFAESVRLQTFSKFGLEQIQSYLLFTGVVTKRRRRFEVIFYKKDIGRLMILVIFSGYGLVDLLEMSFHYFTVIIFVVFIDLYRVLFYRLGGESAFHRNSFVYDLYIQRGKSGYIIVAHIPSSTHLTSEAVVNANVRVGLEFASVVMLLASVVMQKTPLGVFKMDR
uniref:Vacuolar protein sorting-associated protein 51 homolog n=1 Tax=Parascaris equorum TaxID=6256 RepID=A0A914RWK9_PAREQ